jgi:TetR/AcrR family transcriptional regulator
MSDSDSRAKLVAVATPLFAKKGFNGVSVREIASVADINVSMISYYFGGKEGLYGAVLNEQFAVLQRVSDIAELDVEPLKKFELYVRGTLARYRQNPYLLRFYTSELTNPTSCFATIVKPAIQEVVKNLQKFFADGLSHHQFREGLDATDTAIALAGMINFYFLLEPATSELIDHSPGRDEELTCHIMDIFTNGVLK